MSFLSHGFGRLKDLADIPSTVGNELKYLQLDGAGNPTWNTPAGGGGGTPGGATTSIQFNNSGAFGGFGSWTGAALGVPGITTSTYTTDSVVRDTFAIAPTVATRNDANFTIGHTFVPVVDMTVSQLGRLYVAGNTQNHPIGIWEKATFTLVTSGTILAASPSDANGFKFVSITPVVLTANKEYIIGAQEYAAGDTWKDAWNSEGFFNTFINRTGLAYTSTATLSAPNVFGSGTVIYNACTFKFIPSVVGQLVSRFDANNSVSLVSTSNGNAGIYTQNPDKTVSIFSSFAVGQGALATGTKFGVVGNSFFDGNIPVRTRNEANTNAYFGVSNGPGLDGVFARGGFTLLESGSGAGQVLINYDNSARDVSIGGIGAGKFNIYTNSASKIGQIIYAAAAQTANLTEWRNSAGTAMLNVTSTGVINAFGNSTSGSIDSTIRIYNSANASNSGAGIQGNHFDGTSVVPSGVMGFRRWSNGADHGEFCVSLASYGVIGSPLLRLDVNGKLTTATVAANLRIDAGDLSGNPIGLAYGGDQGLRHGFWANDHLDMYVRTAFTNIATIDYMGQWGLGFTNRTGIAARLHARSTNAATSAIIAQGAASQTANLQEWQNSAASILARIDSTGAIYTASASFGGGSLSVTNAFHTMLWNGAILGWSASSGVSPTTTNFDIALRRQAAGVLEVTDGISSSLRDLRLRDLIASQDIESTDSTRGVIIKSPDGTRWRVQVDNAGALTTTSL